LEISQFKQRKLQVIQGGLDDTVLYGFLKIIPAPESAKPFQIDAKVFEEDTWLTISADPKISPPEEHPLRLMQKMLEARPEPVGTVLVHGINPIRFLAIVHDVDSDPTWREEWIEKALRSVFFEAEKYKVHSLALPLLGTQHGKLEKNRFIELLCLVLQETSFSVLQRLWLIIPEHTKSQIIAMLKKDLKIS
jgi:hypothetical protein